MLGLQERKEMIAFILQSSRGDRGSNEEPIVHSLRARWERSGWDPKSSANRLRLCVQDDGEKNGETGWEEERSCCARPDPYASAGDSSHSQSESPAKAQTLRRPEDDAVVEKSRPVCTRNTLVILSADF